MDSGLQNFKVSLIRLLLDETVAFFECIAIFNDGYCGSRMQFLSNSKDTPIYLPREMPMSKPTIYFDMDGVLAYFMKSFSYKCKIPEHGLYVSTQKIIDLQQQHKINSYELFANLLPINQGKILIQHAVKLFGEYSICSHPFDHDWEASVKGKNDWIDANLWPPPKERIFTKDKFNYAVQLDGTPNVLIDDLDHNLEPWRETGGIAHYFDTYGDNLHIIADLQKLSDKYP